MCSALLLAIENVANKVAGECLYHMWMKAWWKLLGRSRQLVPAAGWRLATVFLAVGRGLTHSEKPEAPTATVCVTLLIVVGVNTDFKRSPYFPSFLRAAAEPFADSESQNRQFEPSSDLKRTIRHIVRQHRENMCKHSRFLSFLCGISWRMLLSATVYRHFSRLRIKRRHPQRWDHFRHWQDSESRGA